MKKAIPILLLLVFIVFIITCKKEAANTPPTADFTITPEQGNTDTVFLFDASLSRDKKYEISQLLFRWDFENDSVWDTQFVNEKLESHQYSSEGTYSIKLEVKDPEALSSIKIKNVIVESGNRFPTPFFTISPSIGTIDSVFKFDASGSYDKEDSMEQLLCRWDFENDNLWDTQFDTEKSVSHQYSSDGTYLVKLEVKDSYGLSSFATKNVFVESENTPPTPFFTISPSIGTIDSVFKFDASGSFDAQDSVTSLKFCWDFENDGIWDIYNSSTYVATHQYLSIGTYITRLDVIDSEGLLATISNQLEVIEGNDPPTSPSNPIPFNNATEQDVVGSLSWTCSDPDNDSIIYDIYMGDYSPPPLLEMGWKGELYETDSLNADAIYYWKIVARDSRGATTEGPIWQFKTFRFRVGVNTNIINIHKFSPPLEIGNHGSKITKSLDVDEDELFDFQFYVYSWHSLGGHGGNEFTIQTLNDKFEIIYTEVNDSIRQCTYYGRDFYDRPMIVKYSYNNLISYICQVGGVDILKRIDYCEYAIPYNYGDSISYSENWKAYSQLILNNMSYNNTEGYYDRTNQIYRINNSVFRNGFFNSDTIRYLVFRKKINEDYKFGWLKLSVNSWGVNIHEYAIQK